MEEPVDMQLEQELEGHIEEQRASLVAIDEALESDRTNSELLLVKEELLACVKAAEESVFQLKRARLLRELDAIPSVEEPQFVSTSSAGNLANSPELDLNSEEDAPQLVQLCSFTEGTKCRFRHTDGRWYNGRVHCVESGVARVFFLSPTSEKMQICRFFLQQRCRFGGNCRQSHGMEIPLHALRLFNRLNWETVPLGTTVFACDGDERTGLWKQAELESWDDEFYEKARLVFIGDGNKAVVDANKIALSEHAELSDGSSDSSSEGEEEQEDEVETEGIGILVPAGTQTDTVTFANWEKHTRGVASKMMANMGYRVGMGLGKSGQGQVVPIEARVLPPKQSLDFINEKKRKENNKEGKGGGHEGKKKTRGGKRSRSKKWAAAALAAKIEEDKAPDVFGIINQHLAPVVEDGTSFGSGSKSFGSRASQGMTAQRKTHKEDRRSIVAHEDSIMDIRAKISKLEEMAHRNRKEKAVYDGINRRLEVARNALLEAEAARASATNAVHSKEKEKKWLRF